MVSGSDPIFAPPPFPLGVGIEGKEKRVGSTLNPSFWGYENGRFFLSYSKIYDFGKLEASRKRREGWFDRFPPQRREGKT